MRLVLCGTGLAAMLLASLPAAAGGGPTVFTAPDDVTPFRRSDDTRLFRDRDPFERRDVRPLERQIERDLERELDRLQSRVVADPQEKLPKRRLRRDLEGGEEGLRALQTRQPRAESLPLLERQLDRLERSTELEERVE